MPFSKQDKQLNEERLSGESVAATRTVQNVQLNYKHVTKSKNLFKIDFRNTAIMFLEQPGSNFAT